MRLGEDDLVQYVSAGIKERVTKVKSKMVDAGNKPILTSDKETKRYISDAITGLSLIHI